MKRSTWPTISRRPLASAAAPSASASSSVSAIGFSSRTCRPAASARSAIGRCSGVGRQTSTASTGMASAVSRSPVASAPSRAARPATRSVSSPHTTRTARDPDRLVAAGVRVGHEAGAEQRDPGHGRDDRGAEPVGRLHAGPSAAGRARRARALRRARAAGAAAGPRAPRPSARRSPPSTTASRSPRCGSSTRTATSAAASSATRACSPRRRSKRFWLEPPARWRPWTLRRADLRVDEPPAGEHARGVAAEAHEQHADHAVPARVLEQRPGLEALALAGRPRAAGTAARTRAARRRGTSRARARSSVRVDRAVLLGPALEPAARAAPVAPRSARSRTDSMRRP